MGWGEQNGFSIKPTLLSTLPSLRVVLELNDLGGYKMPELVCWLFSHGTMPIYSPWQGVAEYGSGFQRILKRRALDGHNPMEMVEIMTRIE